VTPWNLACPDWQTKIQSRTRSLLPDLPLLDEAAAKRAVTIFDKLRLPDVPGQPTMGDSAGDWFRDIVRALFGSMDKENAQRMIREIFLLVPKKNSKTTNGAALMVTALLLNKRPNAEFLLIAPTQPITRIAFDQAAGMIEADPKLRDPKLTHIQYHNNTITYLPTGATLQVKSFDPKIVTGVKPAGVLVDELHVVSETASADRVIGQLRGGIISQGEGFLVFITTQSERPPNGVFKAELEKARDIRDGKRTGAMMPVLYEFPDEIAKDQEKWENPDNWWMVTPNRGRSISIERLEDEYRTAKDTSEGEFRRWASQHLNIEIGTHLGTDGWAGAIHWPKGAEKNLTLREIFERCEVLTVGVDGGGLFDLLGVSVIGREKGTQRWLSWSHAFIASDAWDKRKANQPLYTDFIKDGDLTLVDQLPDDISGVVDIVKQCRDSKKLAKVGCDPAGLGTIVDALAAINITVDNEMLGGIRQGVGLMGAIKTVERKLAEGSFRHGGRQMMAWCAGNAVLQQTATGVRIVRDASGYAKIDPLIALLCAAELMATNPEPVRVPQYQMQFA
jgi:phage terminase large subunit-like protein